MPENLGTGQHVTPMVGERVKMTDFKNKKVIKMVMTRITVNDQLKKKTVNLAQN